MVTEQPTAIVYIDGLNLYKQALERYPEYRWLDVLRMCEIMLPTHEIKLVRYYTARINVPVTNPHATSRQDVYLHALKSLGVKISISFGRMSTKDKVFPVSPIGLDHAGNILLSKVRVTEEKGSDVALASQMVLDAAKRKADLFVLISNDSDFEPTLRLIHHELGCQLALLSPSLKPSKSLVFPGINIVKVIRESILRDSQFEDELLVQGRLIKRPQHWVKNGTP